MKKKKLYVSLPITGRDIEDVRRDCAWAHTRYDNEYEVVTPLDVTPDQGEHPYSYYISRDIEVLLTCDAAIFLTFWQCSKGCRLERAVCHIYGIDIIRVQ